ncbi:hypothetical protein BDR07DRAFT_783882 [Suillus spraguei]|nr:hypothetical protein BDR07DRAFT_783882 [Suillus spraguei]
MSMGAYHGEEGRPGKRLFMCIADHLLYSLGGVTTSVSETLEAVIMMKSRGAGLVIQARSIAANIGDLNVPMNKRIGQGGARKTDQLIVGWGQTSENQRWMIE